MTRRVGFPDALRGDFEPVFRSPDLPIPERFTGRGRWKSGPLHTFVDDYRQEFFWRRPEEGLLTAMVAGCATAPDFTVWNDDPEPWREYQAFRSALLASFWQSAGVDVFPVVSFRTSVAHVLPGSLWAVRGPAAQNVDGWLVDIEQHFSRAEPAGYVVFGRCPESLKNLCPVVSRALTFQHGSRGAAQIEGGI